MADTPTPSPETRPVPQPETRPGPGADTRPHPDDASRGLAHDLATQYVDGAAKCAGALTIAALAQGAGKLKDSLTSKDDGPKIELPPGVDRPD